MLESCKSEAEVKKINDQKKLEAELEAAAELERKQEDMAARQSAEKHSAATSIESICRGHSARTSVTKLRRERAEELSQRDSESERKMTIKIQRAFRGHSVRGHFNGAGIDVTSLANRGKDDIKGIVAERVDRDFNNRRLYERLAAIFLLGTLRKRLDKDYENGLVMANEYVAKFDNHKDALKDALDTCNNAVAMLKIELSQTPEQTPEHVMLELDLKTEIARKAHFAYVLEVCDMQLWWVTQHLRQHYRRHRSSVLLSSATSEGLEWLAQETQQLQDLRAFVEERHAQVPDTIENRYFIDWLADQSQRIITQNIGFDMEQEFLISKANSRCGERGRGRAPFSSTRALLCETCPRARTAAAGWNSS